jgi:hypothetical protein
LRELRKFDARQSFEAITWKVTVRGRWSSTCWRRLRANIFDFFGLDKLQWNVIQPQIFNMLKYLKWYSTSGLKVLFTYLNYRTLEYVSTTTIEKQQRKSVAI